MRVHTLTTQTTHTHIHTTHNPPPFIYSQNTSQLLTHQLEDVGKRVGQANVSLGIKRDTAHLFKNLDRATNCQEDRGGVEEAESVMGLESKTADEIQLLRLDYFQKSHSSPPHIIT